MCHGSDARGGRGFPNLTDEHWQWGEGYDQVLHAINNGRQAAMPALGAAWPTDQTNAVVQYVRSLSGLEHDAAAATVGQQTFAVQCIACHGLEGKGNPLLGAPNLTDDYWLYGNDVATLTETLIKGRNGKMPSHADLMSEQQKRQLAAYVTSLSRDG
jgi:cytochrome c oxidase cbb3-type subunit 3